MKSASINTSYKSKIQNDYQILDKHVSQLQSIRDEMVRTHKAMEKRILELNEKGFQDGNFENLHTVFVANVENIRKIEEKILCFEQHCEGLSAIIKQYYSVEI